MITLKDYQIRALGSLQTFFRLCSKGEPPAAAFEKVQRENGLVPDRYLSVAAAGLAPDLPYVCLRVPTGGGKTLMACHAIGYAMRDLLHVDRSVVLWLVPSNTILDQTAEALRDARHPYRRALELECRAIEVLTIEEALRLSRATVEGQTTIIVATIQAFRVEDTTGRKVYDQNGAFAEHMLNVPSDRVSDLLLGVDGKPKPSLVNMLRLRRPIVIVDEAHNARTDLSFATLGNVLPACIVEFTATPARGKQPSNVLHRVSAAELKAAEMVKLPLRVVTRPSSQRKELLNDALTVRQDLEKLSGREAQETGEYLRPILLIQAQRVDACESLRQELVKEFGLAKDQISISTGKLDELRSIKDISSPQCPVRVIITVEKLREGWDCPFAYVLCSLRETRSPNAIEQIVGRILRLPQARTKHYQQLNWAYAFSVSPHIEDVLAELREALEHNGFTPVEAERIVLSVSQNVLPLALQQRKTLLEPNELDVEVAQIQASILGNKVHFDVERREVTILFPLDDEELEALESCARTPGAKAKLLAMAQEVREAERAFGRTSSLDRAIPYERQLDFIVPRLCVRETNGLFEFESTHLLERPWQLGQQDASLPDDYDPRQRPRSQQGVIDVNALSRVETSVNEREAETDFVATLQQQVFALGNSVNWTQEQLIVWLDRQIDHRDIPYSESAEFLRKAIRGLMAKYGLQSVDMLALDRYRLRDAIEARIQEHREHQRKTIFQQYLLDDRLAVSDDQAINFLHVPYDPSWRYEGGFQFKKHYFGPKPGELRENTSSGQTTEEFKCAQHIDGMLEIAYWVRNLSRRPYSFRLQTSKDWFYPDFVCQLRDGRILVVEYKGKHLYEGSDADEKRAVGSVWQARSEGKCLFVMPTEGNFSEINRVVKAG